MKQNLPIRWLLFPTYLVVALLAVIVPGWFGIRLLQDVHQSQADTDLKARAELVAAAVGRPDVIEEIARVEQPGEPARDASLRYHQLRGLVRELGARTGARISIIALDGTALADSDLDAEGLDNHSSREEIAEALRSGEGTSHRFSHTSQREMTYKAITLERGGTAVAIVRIGVPTVHLDTILGPARGRLLAAALLAAILATLLSFAIARWLARPFEEMRRAATHFSRGELSYRVQSVPSEEGLRLAEAMNSMAAQLERRIADLEQRNREQETLLAGMVEGVIAVDPANKLLIVNRAARELFQVGPQAVEGRPLGEVIRHPDFTAFLRKTLDSADPVEDDLILREPRTRYLHLHGSALRLSGGQRVGAIVVLNDVTRQRNMENERRELVASVSHELRTPVTAIKGFLETLRDGAVDEPAEARRFVEIALRQTQRLHNLIEDLLQLARLEREIQRSEIVLERQAIRPVLEAAIETSRGTPDGAKAKLVLDCAEELEADIHQELLEQAVVNLLTNAIRYGGGEIRVEGRRIGPRVEIVVQDHGPGIPLEHQERLFERFYTVDKARSRRHGGTGLGLAIVKHVARAHGGDVSVSSSEGKGARFTIRLPGAQGRT